MFKPSCLFKISTEALTLHLLVGFLVTMSGGGGGEGAPSASVDIILVGQDYWGVLEISHGMGMPDCSRIVSSLMALGGLTPDTLIIHT